MEEREVVIGGGRGSFQSVNSTDETAIEDEEGLKSVARPVQP